jgi:pimeloyl-ACP methyl ester carboxylesterase
VLQDRQGKEMKDTLNLFVERSGHGERILFVHGSGWNSRMWHNQRDGLQSSFEVVLVDLPGHGRSPGDGCDSVERYRDAVLGVIEGLAPEKCYVAGHSLGGAVALSLALSRPDVLKGVVLIGTGAKLRVLPQILDNVTKNKEQTVAEIVSLAFSQKAPSELKDYDFRETMKCSAEVILKDFTACDRFNVMDSIDSLDLPALVVCGTDDNLTPPKYSLYLHKAIKKSRLVLIEDAGHMVMMEKPDDLNSAVAEFIRQVERTV